MNEGWVWVYEWWVWLIERVLLKIMGLKYF